MVTVVLSHRSHCHPSVFLCRALLFQPLNSMYLPHKEAHRLGFGGSLGSSLMCLIKNMNICLMFKPTMFKQIINIFHSLCLPFLIYKIKGIRSYITQTAYVIYINSIQTNKRKNYFSLVLCFPSQELPLFLWFWSNEEKQLYFIYKTFGFYLNGSHPGTRDDLAI